MIELIPTVSYSEASSYLQGRPNATSVSQTSLEGALKLASKLISGAFVFHETAYTVNDVGTISWNQRVLDAVCEQAFYLLNQNPESANSSVLKGIASASAGAVSVTYDKGLLAPLISETARIMIGNLAVFIGNNELANVFITQLSL